jgi:hypothetical protein
LRIAGPQGGFTKASQRAGATDAKIALRWQCGRVA